jgi:hypothetical protein
LRSLYMVSLGVTGFPVSHIPLWTVSYMKILLL